MKISGIRVILRWAARKKWLDFRDPVEICSADSLSGVIPCLERVRAGVEKRGLWAAGFVTYEAAPAFDSALRCVAPGPFPLLWFGLFREPASFRLPALVRPLAVLSGWRSSVSRREYAGAIRRVKKLIRAGATYQVNYTYRLLARFSGDPLSFFLAAVAGQDIPYAAFIDIGRFAVCSLSPELFFSLSPRCGGEIVSKPMKGTMPRGLMKADDDAAGRALAQSPKNRAENVMIVDMVRNDLGRIALPGSVEVASLCDVEKYATVWQMTSTVRARTKAGLPDIFRALFPPASITGAPKAMTTRIISSLETSPRGVYTGAAGFAAPGRRMQFNVAIRTLLVDREQSRAEYGVGGGIVWDSLGAEEYSESMLKAQIVCSPEAPFELLETMLWTPRGGYFLLGRHLKRMEESAAYFSYPFDEARLRARLARLACSLPRAPHRVRLLLSRQGGITLQAGRYEPRPPGAGLFARLAKEPVDSKDRFLYHKTTNRRIYDNALKSVPGCDDAILWNEKGQITEFCTGNIVVMLDGQLTTPPVSCGLLPGTYRAWLLMKGRITERVLKPGDLRRCRAVYLCNSVRKMQEVRCET